MIWRQRRAGQLCRPRPGLVDSERDGGPAISALRRESFPCVDVPLRHPYFEDAAAGKTTEISSRRCAACIVGSLFYPGLVWLATGLMNAGPSFLAGFS